MAKEEIKIKTERREERGSGAARRLLRAAPADGSGCLYGLPTSCRVPPNSAVTITFEYKGLGY